MKRKVCLITTNRADYGLQRNLIFLLKKNKKINFKLLVSGSHHSKEYGSSIKEITSDKNKIDFSFKNKFKKASSLSTLLSMSESLKKFSQILAKIKPSIVIILGDRYEMLMAAVASTIHNFPIAHIQGGETTQGAFDDSIRHSITKMSSLHFVAHKNYKKVLDKNPNSKSANLNMLLLSHHMKDHDVAKQYLVKLLGPDPERLSSTCAASGCMGKIPFLFPVGDSSAYQITVQIQVRNASDELIAIIESDRIKYTPHPIMDKILSNYDVVNTIQNEQGIFEETRIVEKSEPKINPYFMDRVELFYNDYNVLFAYNMAIPLESEDYIITEWIIQKKI